MSEFCRSYVEKFSGKVESADRQWCDGHFRIGFFSKTAWRKQLQKAWNEDWLGSPLRSKGTTTYWMRLMRCALSGLPAERGWLPAAFWPLPIIIGGRYTSPALAVANYPMQMWYLRGGHCCSGTPCDASCFRSTNYIKSLCFNNRKWTVVDIIDAQSYNHIKSDRKRGAQLWEITGLIWNLNIFWGPRLHCNGFFVDYFAVV